MLLTTFDVCSGPKKEDCTVLTAKIIGKNSVFVNNKVIRNCNPSKVTFWLSVTANRITL